MYAVIATGGKQYKISTGDRFKVEKLNGEVGKSIELDDVLLIADGDNVQVGRPMVKEAKVVAEILKHGRGEKVIAFKRKRREHYHRKVGHRQEYTELEVKEIRVGGE
jgi:large subunit ribosomal protein L21